MSFYRNLESHAVSSWSNLESHSEVVDRESCAVSSQTECHAVKS